MTSNPTLHSTDFIPESAVTLSRGKLIALAVIAAALLLAPGSLWLSLDVLVALGLLLPRGNGDTFDKMRVTGLGLYVMFRGLDLYGLLAVPFLDAVTLAILLSLVLPNLVKKLRRG